MSFRFHKVTLIAALGLCVVSCKGDGSFSLFGHKHDNADPILVKVVTIGQSVSSGSSSYVGSVESSRTSVVTSPAPGTLRSLNVRKGQTVYQGQTIATVESQALVSSLKMAQATYDQAKDGMDRLKQVYGTGSVAAVKMVEMQTNLEKAEAAVEAAQKALDNCRVSAPFSGVVEEVTVTAGIELGVSQPICTIVDVNGSEIHFPLPENEFSKVPVGTEVTVSIPALGKTITGSISSKGAVASQLSHSYDCILGNLSDSNGIMPGMVCKVYIKSDGQDSIIIPSSAVMVDNDGRYVWTVKDGIVGKNHIVVSGYSGDGVIVAEGLSDDLAVIVEGVRKVSTGMAVKTEEKW